MVYNPFEVLIQSESMCREIYGILESNGERPDLCTFYQYVFRPDVIVVSLNSIGSCAIKELFAAGYHASFFGGDRYLIEVWLSKK